MARIAIDPVTRVGGHLRIEADVAGGVVSDAWVSGTMFRGHRADPARAATRATPGCSPSASAGRAPSVHALASVRAVENALGIDIPTNARLIRNVLAGHAARRRPRRSRFYHAPGARLGRRRRRRSPPTRPRPSALARLDRAPGRARLGVLQGRPGPPRRRRSVRPAGPVRRTAPGAIRPTACRPEQSLLLARPLARGARLARAASCGSTRCSAARARTRRPTSSAAWPLAPPWGGPTRRSTGEHPWVARPRRADRPRAPTGIAMIEALIAEAPTFVEQVFVPGRRSRSPRLPGLGARSARASATTSRSASSREDGRTGRAVPAARPGHGSRPQPRWSRSAEAASRRPSRTPGTRTATATGAPRTRPRARPSPPTRARAAADRARRARTGTAGSRRRATTASRWRSARWPGCSSAYGERPVASPPRPSRRRCTTLGLGAGRPVRRRSAGCWPGPSRPRLVAEHLTAGSRSSRRTSPPATSRSPTSRLGPGIVAVGGRGLVDGRGSARRVGHWVAITRRPDRALPGRRRSTWNASPRDARAGAAPSRRRCGDAGRGPGPAASRSCGRSTRSTRSALEPCRGARS